MLKFNYTLSSLRIDIHLTHQCGTYSAIISNLIIYECYNFNLWHIANLIVDFCEFF